MHIFFSHELFERTSQWCSRDVATFYYLWIEKLGRDLSSVLCFQALEDEMVGAGLSEEEKEDRRKDHYKKESNYLRIKRQRLAYSDFETLKIIGKGTVAKKLEFCNANESWIEFSVDMNYTEMLVKNQKFVSLMRINKVHCLQ